MVMRVKASRPKAYRYRKSIVKGVTQRYEKTHPAIKSAVAGIISYIMEDLSWGYKAGFTKAAVSRMIMGVLITMPKKRDTYSWAMMAWAGVITASLT